MTSGASASPSPERGREPRARCGRGGGRALIAAAEGKREPLTAALLRLNRRTFSSFKYRNYRLFFFGQAVSQTGSWMQRIALGWFVLQLTHSAFAVGIMAVAHFLPFTIFGLFGGVLVDRLDAHRTVIGTQVAQLAAAIALAAIVIGD